MNEKERAQRNLLELCFALKKLLPKNFSNFFDLKVTHMGWDGTA